MDTRTAAQPQHSSAFDTRVVAGSSALATSEPAVELAPGLWAREDTRDGRFALEIERSGAALAGAMVQPSMLLLLAAVFFSSAVGSLLSAAALRDAFRAPLAFVLALASASVTAFSLAAVAAFGARRRAVAAFEGGRYQLDADAFTVDSTTMTWRDERPTSIRTDQLFGFCAVLEGKSCALGVITRDGEVLSVQSNVATPVVVAYVVEQLNAALSRIREARTYR